MFHASWRWIVVAMLVLFLLSGRRWYALIARAGSIDEQHRELARIAFAYQFFPESFALWSKAHLVLLGVVVKLGHDGIFLCGAYLFGMAAGWFWGVP